MPDSPFPPDPGEVQQLKYVLTDIAVTLEQAFARSERVYARASRLLASGTLQDAPYNLDGRQVAWLKRLVTDLHNLRQVAYGAADPSGPYNFMGAVMLDAGFR